MRVSHECTARVTPFSAAERLQAFIAGRRSSKEPCGDMECLERELHEYVVEGEREVLAEELARLDVDLPTVTIEGEVYRQVVRCEETYTSAAGPVRVMRSLYRRGGKGSGRRAHWSYGR
jgi:phage baseplate assembly protein gpV